MADWLIDHHVPVVADYASELAPKYGADPDLARAAALLHDVADVQMPRPDPKHEEESLALAEKLLRENGYRDEELRTVVDDAARFHSCRGTALPQTLEGKVLATADALAHFKTDFYAYLPWAIPSSWDSFADVKQWVLEKIDRDLNIKIFFDDERAEVLADYQMIKQLYSR